MTNEEMKNKALLKEPLKVVLCWHMHQPQYKNTIQGDYQLPWTYLHAIKDYIDMAYHLEKVPKARAVINFAPILLEQIDDYCQQIQAYIDKKSALTDPLLASLVSAEIPKGQEQRIGIIKNCLRVNEKRLINRFPEYRRLVDLAHQFLACPDELIYLNQRYYYDLLVWYHLAWLGESVRRDNKDVIALIKKGKEFTFEDRRTLFNVIAQLMMSVIDRYKSLLDKGQIELSMTPYAHPIVPLLLDLNSARDAMPDVQLPTLPTYPGGEQRVRWHFEQGIATFERFFGFRPQGCWPSEGSLCDNTMRMLDDYGFQWTASGESVFHNSVGHAQNTEPNSEESAANLHLYQPYRVAQGSTACFFRDDGLSDLIGFTYATWHADDAVANLIHHLENIAKASPENEEKIVSIILDGENAWESYPDNAYYFLNALYEKLSVHENIELTTFSRCLQNTDSNVRKLPHIVAGSWVYGTFATWIGHADKNRGWDMLGDVKRKYDEVIKNGRFKGLFKHAKLGKINNLLAICEGSDWFWWFGDDNPEDSVSQFEQLYRSHLRNLYTLLEEEPPAYLSQVFTHGQGAPELGGVMRQGSKNTLEN